MQCRHVLVGIVLLSLASTARADTAGTLEPLLEKGDLAGAAKAMQARIDRDKFDDEAWFGLGITRFLQAVEGLAQRNQEYGVASQYARAIPGLRLPVPPNENPKKVAYEDVRNSVKQFLADLGEAQKALGKVDTANDVKLPLHIGRIRLDLDGDGKATDAETFWQIFQIYNAGVRREDGEAFVLGLDGGDVHWLKGYTHFLSAMCEVTLAHDFRELFERTGHLFFPSVETPHDYLSPPDPRDTNLRTIFDAIAFVHLLNFEVEEPKRMQTALEHLETMVDESRISWKRILAETDDDHEWLPNPEQTSIVPGGRVSREMIDGWHEVLDEIEAILAGEKLVPFWRDYYPQWSLFGRQRDWQPIPARGRGVNVRKVFTNPRRLDLVMWLQGTGATPYLETGELSTPESWGRMMRVFRGEFFGFAIWFN